MSDLPKPYSIDFNVKVRTLSEWIAPNYKIMDTPQGALDAWQRGIVYTFAPTVGAVDFFSSRGVAEEFNALICAAGYKFYDSTELPPSPTDVFKTVASMMFTKYGLDEAVIEALRILWVLIVKLPIEERKDGPVLNYRTFVEQYKKDQ